MNSNAKAGVRDRWAIALFGVAWLASLVLAAMDFIAHRTIAWFYVGLVVLLSIAIIAIWRRKVRPSRTS